MFLKILTSLIRVRGHALSTLGLGPESVVIDAGAHRGEFSRALTDRFGCQCYLIEANAALAEQLGLSGYAGVAAAALGESDGRAVFYVRDNLESSSVFYRDKSALTTSETEVISLPTMMERFGLERIDVLKLDVEGSEFAILNTAPAEVLTQIGQITVEFHDFAPAFRGQGLYEAAQRRLRSLGFASFSMAFRTHGDVLFLNKRQFPVSSLAVFGLAGLGRWRLRMMH